MDRGQRKRLADICEKLGVAFFAGVALKGILADTVSVSLVVGSVLVGLIGLVLLGAAISLSKEI